MVKFRICCLWLQEFVRQSIPAVSPGEFEVKSPRENEEVVHECMRCPGFCQNQININSHSIHEIVPLKFFDSLEESVYAFSLTHGFPQCVMQRAGSNLDDLSAEGGAPRIWRFRSMF